MVGKQHTLQSSSPLTHNILHDIPFEKKDGDLLAKILQAYDAQLPADSRLAPVARQKLEHDLRTEYGGDFAYITKRDTQRNLAIVNEYLRGCSGMFLSRKYGVSERQVRRIIAATQPST